MCSCQQNGDGFIAFSQYELLRSIYEEDFRGITGRADFREDKNCNEILNEDFSQ